jgi:TonB family protein
LPDAATSSFLKIDPRIDAYSAREIAAAIGSTEEAAVRLMGHSVYVPFDEALRVGRVLVRIRRSTATKRADGPLFSMLAADGWRSRWKRLPLVVSSTLHVLVLAVAVFLATAVEAPTAATLSANVQTDPARLVFIVSPGPGGGGGGGGLLQKAQPPKARREGHHSISSPLPARVPPRPIEPVPAPPEPKPAPLDAEPLPVVAAPIVPAPADSTSRIGTLDETRAENASHGSGRGGGVGTGTGTGLGEGEGSGVGPGSGGGTGGGPYRPGSGIEPPRLLREVKADYTDEARVRGITGEVVLEIVVRRDGSVGDVKVLRGLGSGLNDRAAQAVRQWRFTAARRQGTPVDVIVEVAVEFKLR